MDDRCEVKAIWWLIRHGSRNPGHDDIDSDLTFVVTKKKRTVDSAKSFIVGALGHMN